MTYASDYNQPKVNYFASEDLTFIAGDSPVVIDVHSVLRKEAIDGWIECRSSSVANNGNIQIEISSDGTTYGASRTMFSGDLFSLSGLKVNRIRITHTGTNSGYQVFAR